MFYGISMLNNYMFVIICLLLCSLLFLAVAPRIITSWDWQVVMIQMSGPITQFSLWTIQLLSLLPSNQVIRLHSQWRIARWPLRQLKLSSTRLRTEPTMIEEQNTSTRRVLLTFWVKMFSLSSVPSPVMVTFSSLLPHPNRRSICHLQSR